MKVDGSCSKSLRKKNKNKSLFLVNISMIGVCRIIISNQDDFRAEYHKHKFKISLNLKSDGIGSIFSTLL